MAEEDIVLSTVHEQKVIAAKVKAKKKAKKVIDDRPVTTKITPVKNDYTARIMAKLDSRIV